MIKQVNAKRIDCEGPDNLDPCRGGEGERTVEEEDGEVVTRSGGGGGRTTCEAQDDGGTLCTAQGGFGGRASVEDSEVVSQGGGGRCEGISSDVNDPEPDCVGGAD